MRKIIISFVLMLICISSFFPKDKIAENADSLTYSYSEWNEFYSDIVETANNPTYNQAYLTNKISNENLENILNTSKNNSWNLKSFKLLSDWEMKYIFIIVSPNKHFTILTFTGSNTGNRIFYRSSTFSGENSIGREIAKKRYSDDEDNENIFIKDIILPFDTQLSFFDEKIPLKFSDFYTNLSNLKTESR